MHKQQQNKIVRIIVAVLLLILLVSVRFFESSLFYDPLLQYFKGQYQHSPLPEIEYLFLFLNIGFRYFLNTIISLSLLYVIFKDIHMIKFTAVLYAVFFVVLISILIFTMSNEEPDNMLIFYVRRFLIQPIFILLFIPAFLFQEYVTKKPDGSPLD